MKRTIIIVLVLATAGIVAWILSQDRYEQTAFSVDDFSIQDPSVITRIELSDKYDNSVSLEKKGDTWWVDGKYPAFEPQMDLFLDRTINKINVKGPVPSQAKNNVIQMMVGHSVHVILFEGDEELNNFYVGSTTPNQSGSYVHIKGSNVPYIAHIPGGTSVLYPKFPTDPKVWYDKTIFDFEPQEISSITVEHHHTPEHSFTLTRNDTTYAIDPAVGQLSQEAARSYFALYQFRNLEGYAEYLTDETKDTIMQMTPFMTIGVQPVQGDAIELRIFKKGSADRSLFDRNGNPIVEDTERYFATFTGFDDLVTIQGHVFDKLMIPRQYFEAI